jgi:ribosomal protein S18 acetylase RimI-like enzyme
MTTKILPLTKKDLPFLYTALQKDLKEQHVLHRFQYSEVEFSLLFFGPQPIAKALILWTDKEPIGFAIYNIDHRNFTTNRGPNLYLNDLYVKAECRRQGGATLLLKTLQNIAKQNGCGRIEWLVQPENKAAQALYKRYSIHNMNAVLNHIRMVLA